MSNVVPISTHPRFRSGVFAVSGPEEALPPKWYPAGEPAQHFAGRLAGHEDVLAQLRTRAQELLDESFRMRTLNAESQAKIKEEQGKMLLALVASLPTKLRAT